MDLNFFADPGLAPKPRSEIRIEKFAVSAYPEGRRVRIEIELTPFIPADRPNIEITAFRADGMRVGSTTIIEAVQRLIALTMHLREPEQPQGDYQFTADLYYGEEPPQHSVTEVLTITSNASDEQTEA
jgi:hypothetical protein